MRGPYGYSYPAGYYDHIYEPDDNPNPSEPRPVFVEMPSGNSNNNVTSSRPGDEDDEEGMTTTMTPMDRRSDRHYNPPVTIPPPDPDADDLEQRSFGFKVTVYKTPTGKGMCHASERKYELALILFFIGKAQNAMSH